MIVQLLFKNWLYFCAVYWTANLYVEQLMEVLPSGRRSHSILLFYMKYREGYKILCSPSFLAVGVQQFNKTDCRGAIC